MLNANGSIRWTREYRCPACGARVMRKFDSPRGTLMDNDPVSGMGLHVCAAEAAERDAFWVGWQAGDQRSALGVAPVAHQTRQEPRRATTRKKAELRTAPTPSRGPGPF